MAAPIRRLFSRREITRLGVGQRGSEVLASTSRAAKGRHSCGVVRRGRSHGGIFYLLSGRYRLIAAGGQAICEIGVIFNVHVMGGTPVRLARVSWSIRHGSRSRHGVVICFVRRAISGHAATVLLQNRGGN